MTNSSKVLIYLTLLYFLCDWLQYKYKSLFEEKSLDFWNPFNFGNCIAREPRKQRSAHMLGKLCGFFWHVLRRNAVYACGRLFTISKFYHSKTGLIFFSGVAWYDYDQLTILPIDIISTEHTDAQSICIHWSNVNSSIYL